MVGRIGDLIWDIAVDSAAGGPGILIASIFRARMDADGEETKTMQAVELPEQALELSFHPHRDVVASGLLTGKVCL